MSDIHGCVDQLDELLLAVSYNPVADDLILLGDYVDRGPKSKESVERVMQLVENDGAVALRGNHDQRFADLIRADSEELTAKFLEHGGIQTLQSYCDLTGDQVVDPEVIRSARAHVSHNYSRHIDFLRSLPLFHEDRNHIYVHAGLNPNFKNWRDQPEHDFMYIKKEFHQAKLSVGKTVIFGHTRTVELQQSPDVWFGDGKIGIDGGCAYGMQLNGLIYYEGVYSTVSVPNNRRG
ncbi:metallophosphoesterase [Cohnella faecalis]|uniref:metallophosphoesterase n=1 Tax=Cohnella faecalis TaxID=2315694 RepID=UPI001F23E524|nr:metallophosphoesterase [Cohnella faecalis]